MNWSEIISKIILWALGLAGTGISVFFTYLINKKIKNKDTKALINDTVKHCVLDVYQTYVEALKDKNVFDADAQKEALNKCLELIKKELPATALSWLNLTYNNIEEHLKTLIESQIGQLKRGE